MDLESTISLKNIDIDTINELYNKYWEENTEKSVEYFEDDYTTIKLVSFDDPLDEYLSWLDDGQPISFDHQWSNQSRNQNENYISLFQFCSTKGILLIKREPDTQTKNDSLLNFMLTHDFFTKVAKYDYIKLKQALGPNASQIKFEDITRTRLLPNGESISFDKMVDKFCENKPFYTFNNNKRIQILSWVQNPLKQIQVLFAGYKVKALHQAMKSLPEPDMHFIPNDSNVPMPIQYIQGISHFKVSPNVKYMFIYGSDEISFMDLVNLLGLKKTFRNLFMFTKDGEINKNNGKFDKAIIEVENLVQFRKRIIKSNLKTCSIDASLWEIENES